MEGLVAEGVVVDYLGFLAATPQWALQPLTQLYRVLHLHTIGVDGR